MVNKRILVVAAHPDDEVLGCGGTVARLVEEGNEAYTLILGEGITSRDKVRSPEKRKTEIEELKREAHKANDIIGIKGLFMRDFPDNRFDTVPLLDVVKTIEEVKSEIKPDIVFTHYSGDLNKDHAITYQAVLIATRPVRDETTKEIYAFEVLSSTEYGYPMTFSPDVFFDISSTLGAKLRAMKEYESELTDDYHSRSLKNIEINAKMWGAKVGRQHVEAFKLVRRLNV
jgi:LmbE family N-acetylglucosaminyl deacetylase